MLYYKATAGCGVGVFVGASRCAQAHRPRFSHVLGGVSGSRVSRLDSRESCDRSCAAVFCRPRPPRGGAVETAPSLSLLFSPHPLLHGCTRSRFGYIHSPLIVQSRNERNRYILYSRCNLLARDDR